MIAELLRVRVPAGEPQYGALRVNGRLTCLTMERPWLNNTPLVSCIPTGDYVCLKVKDRATLGGMAIPVTYEIINVPNRAGILFHIGSFLRDTKGCVLTGSGVDTEGGEPMLFGSRKGFEKFLQDTCGLERFDLEIREV